MACFPSSNLVKFIQENNPVIFYFLNSFPAYLIHINKLLCLFLFENIDCLGNSYFSLLLLSRKYISKNILEVYPYFFNTTDRKHFQHLWCLYFHIYLNSLFI